MTGELSSGLVVDPVARSTNCDSFMFVQLWPLFSVQSPIVGVVDTLHLVYSLYSRYLKALHVVEASPANQKNAELLTGLT